MTVPLPSRRAAHEFARVVEDSAPVGGEMADLVQLVGELRELGRSMPGPSPTFRERLWQRLSALDADTLEAGERAGGVAAARGVPATTPAHEAGLHPWRRRVAISGFAVGVIAGMATGTTLASTSALPGDALYGVKRTVEDVRLALADSDAAKGERYLEIAKTRLHEIRRMLERSSDPDPSAIDQITDTFSDMRWASGRGSQLLIASYEQTHDRMTLVTLLEEIDEQRAEIDEIQSIAPIVLQDDSATARALLEAVTTDVLHLDPQAVELRDPDASIDTSGDGDHPSDTETRLPPEPRAGVSGVVPVRPRPDAVDEPGKQGVDESEPESDGSWPPEEDVSQPQGTSKVSNNDGGVDEATSADRSDAPPLADDKAQSGLTGRVDRSTGERRAGVPPEPAGGRPDHPGGPPEHAGGPPQRGQSPPDPAPSQSAKPTAGDEADRRAEPQPTHDATPSAEPNSERPESPD